MLHGPVTPNAVTVRGEDALGRSLGETRVVRHSGFSEAFWALFVASPGRVAAVVAIGSDGAEIARKPMPRGVY
jgi:hypothetical protein